MQQKVDAVNTSAVNTDVGAFDITLERFFVPFSEFRIKGFRSQAQKRHKQHPGSRRDACAAKGKTLQFYFLFDSN